MSSVNVSTCVRLSLIAIVVMTVLLVLGEAASLERQEASAPGNWNRAERAAPRAAIGDIMYRFHKRTPKYGIGMGGRFSSYPGKRQVYRPIDEDFLQEKRVPSWDNTYEEGGQWFN